VSLEDPAMPQSPHDAFDARVDRLRRLHSGRFSDLARCIGQRPETDLRFGDFSGCRFEGDDVRGFDFTGCDLGGATFERARIEGAKFDGARLDPGALRRAADYDSFLKADVARKASTRHRLNTSRFRDFAIFREAPFAPEMVVIPAGEFMMGSDRSDTEIQGDDKASYDELASDEGKRLTRIPWRFAMGRYPVTFEEYDVFTDATDRERLTDRGWGRARRPVINVSPEEARAYIDWLNKKLGSEAYRLPLEAEWEYVCRAGTNTRRWWGDSWDPKQANGAQNFEGGRTSLVDQSPPNPWGLRDMIGNVLERCAGRFDDFRNRHSQYEINATPASLRRQETDDIQERDDIEEIWRLEEELAELRAKDLPNVDERRRIPKLFGDIERLKRMYRYRGVLRGGSWADQPNALRSASRVQDDSYHEGCVGFRLYRTL